MAEFSLPYVLVNHMSDGKIVMHGYGKCYLKDARCTFILKTNTT
jgi:hypothetical protein